MINLYAEAKMTDLLKKFLVSAMNKEYVYSFLDDIEVLPVLNSFKFGQQRLMRGEVQFHHQQLVTLARYYYYHNSDENKKENRDEVRKLMLEWVSTFIRAMSYFSGTEVNSWCIDRFMNGSYRIPHYDNTFPFDSIITEAIMKGILEEKLSFPDPKGLIVLNSKGEEKPYDGNDNKFWIRQYAELCATAKELTKASEEEYKTAKKDKEVAETHLKMLEDTRDTAKKEYKAAKKGKEVAEAHLKILKDTLDDVEKEVKKASKEFNNSDKKCLDAKKAMEKIENYVNSLRDAFFILGVSYAQQNAESNSLDKPKKKEKSEEIRECFEFRTDLIRRSFTCFSTAENLNILKASEGFGKYIRKYELVRGSGYEYIFYDPNEEREDLPEVTLPNLAYIDNGLRIGDDDGFFYGLKMSQLIDLMNYNTQKKKRNVSSDGEKNEYVDIIKRNPDGSYNIICDDLIDKVKKVLKYYYLSYVFRIIFAWSTVFGDKHWSFIESLRKGEKLTNELIQELYQFAGGLNDRVKKVSNNDKNNTDKPTKTQSYAIDVNNVIKDIKEIGDVKDRDMIIDSKAEVLKSKLISLIKRLWKKGAPNHQALMKEHVEEHVYDAGKEEQLKSFIDSLQNKFVPALLLSGNQVEAAADLFARLAVMAKLINDDSGNAVDKSQVIWNPNTHLCYVKDDTFRIELLSEYDKIKAEFKI